MRDPSEVIAEMEATARNGFDAMPFALDKWAGELRACLSTPQPAAADVDDGLDEIAHKLESWTRAYPVDIFSEPSKEDLDWLHATRPGLCDRISASMGRHMVTHMTDMAAQVRKLVKGDSHAG